MNKLMLVLLVGVLIQIQVQDVFGVAGSIHTWGVVGGVGVKW